MEEMKLPDTIKNILTRYSRAGYKAYVVGGAVRDFLLKRKVHDYDLAVDASFEEMKALFPEGKFFTRGMKHDTVIFHKDGQDVEITQFRGKDKRSLEEDLALRDFTIDSLAYKPEEGIVDSVNGLKDLQNGIIRLTGEDDSRFQEDPLRMLRALRLAEELSFTIEKKTKEYILQDAALIKKVAPERIKDEINRIVVFKDSDAVIKEYFPLFRIIFPDLAPMENYDQRNKWHNLDLLSHTLKVLQGIKHRSVYMCLAALYHDTGKPVVAIPGANGQWHYYGHPLISSEIAEEAFKELKYDNKTIDKIVKLCLLHDENIQTEADIKSTLNNLGPSLTKALFELKTADHLAQNQDLAYPDVVKAREGYKTTCRILKEKACYQLKDLAINGEDVIKLGIKEGKDVGRVLQQCLKAVQNNEISNNKETLETYIKNKALKE